MFLKSLATIGTGFEFRQGQEIFSSPKRPDWLGDHPAPYTKVPDFLPGGRVAGPGSLPLTGIE